MGAERKPRSDSPLKNFPEDYQDAIAEWCRAPKTEESPGGLQHAREMLASDGHKVSLRAVSEFFAWYRVREDLRGLDNKSKTFEELLKQEFPGASAEKIAAFGQLYFTAKASNAEDVKTFIALEQLRLDKATAETKAKFEKEKIAIREKAEKRAQAKLQFEIGKHLDQTAEKMLSGALKAKAEEINNSGMSQAEKIAAMRKHAFADVDAFLEQGKLDLPE